MPSSPVDPPAIAVGAVSVAAAVVVVAADVVPAADSVPAVLVPVLFVVAGCLGPVWEAARFTCRMLVAIGALHILAIGASVLMRTAAGAAPELQAVSLLLFAAGFVALLPLAAGYPGGPIPRPVLAVASACLFLPLVAVFSGPTPAVLSQSGVALATPPVAQLLPAWMGAVAPAVLLTPLAAVVLAVVRAVRGGRELRGRLVLPLVALGLFALLLVAGALSSAPAVTNALFLASAPLVPAGLVLGARPLRVPLDILPAGPTVRLDHDLQALSPREREVLAAMADGQTNAVIARRLHMSLSAVEKHSTAIFTKLGLPPDATTHRRVAAVVAYLRAASG